MQSLLTRTRKYFSKKEITEGVGWNAEDSANSEAAFTITPVYVKTELEAIAESRRRRDREDGMITTWEQSPYGGYRVYSVPVDMVVDELIKPTVPQITGNIFVRRK